MVAKQVFITLLSNSALMQMITCFLFNAQLRPLSTQQAANIGFTKDMGLP
jgi:hypothetical protein